MTDFSEKPHNKTKRGLIALGFLFSAAGLVCTVVGSASFFSALGSGELPLLFWLLIAGLPMLTIGASLLTFGLKKTPTPQSPAVQDAVPAIQDAADAPKAQTSPDGITTGHTASDAVHGTAFLKPCPKCGTKNTANAKFCEQCGAELPAVCPHCGEPVGERAQFCAACGKKL